MEEPSYFQSTGEPNYDPVKTVLTAARQWMQAARATAKESKKVQVFLAWEPPWMGLEEALLAALVLVVL